MARTVIKHQPPPGVVLSTVPTIRGRTGVHRWLNDVLGVPVSLNFVREAAASNQMHGVKMSDAVFYSTQSLFDWIMSHVPEATS